MLWWSKDKRADKTKEGLGMQEQKTQTLMSLFLPRREKLFAYPVYMPHPISTWSHSLYPEYKSGLRTPVQHQFSLELARCSNSVSHSNKFYFPLKKKKASIPLLQILWLLPTIYLSDSTNNNNSLFKVSSGIKNSIRLTCLTVYLVAQWCLTLCDPMDCSSPGSFIYDIFQARILEWVTIFLLQGIFPN